MINKILIIKIQISFQALINMNRRKENKINQVQINLFRQQPFQVHKIKQYNN